MKYSLPLQPKLSSHFPGSHFYVADGDDTTDDSDMNNLLIEARLRSGDYIVTLATELEKLAEILERQDIAESTALLQMSSELHYLDKHYRLQPK